MATNVNLDPDTYSLIAARAGAKGISISEAVSELIRRAEDVSVPRGDTGRLVMNEYGYLEIRATGNVVTPEMVKALSEDELV